MIKLALQLYRDEAGFVVSAELVLIATMLVIGLIVGLSEVAHGVNNELNDVGDSFGSVNQSFRYSGFQSNRGNISSAGSRGEGLGMGRGF
jgi:hypothetical protein